ncbi:16S rRNA (cytosine(967)-C(5))-methyltransferase RsmB [Eubacteriales bacterium OttesenSCG-928-G02]|nr:16S rRNA (cytosine(967)-C(5))-methyltransferase RsmB [Eubacteriales bacterium OttesenSCG-928-G02]
MGITSRSAAYDILLNIVNNKAFSNIEISNTLSKISLSEQDKSLCHAIVITALEKLNTLDYVIDLYVKSKPDSKTKIFLYIGITQILFLDKIPDNSACDETIKAAKEVIDQVRCGFVNGVLRNICRNKAFIYKNIENSEESIKYSLDNSIVNLIKKQYPNEYTEIFKSFANPLPMCLTVNRLKTSLEEVCEKLNNIKVEFFIHEGIINITKGTAEVLKFIDDGLYYIQGSASQYAASLLECRENDFLIDTCACPGGKSLYSAIQMNNTGEILALDINENKLKLIQKSAKKLGTNIIKTQKNDSRKVLEKYIGKADKVICDVPCSGLGVINSKPEIRYKNFDDIENLITTQRNILTASASYLKQGGILVYSTCTINKNENEDNINYFLNNNKEFVLEYQKTFLPNRDNTEGFYVAKMRKNTE